MLQVFELLAGVVTEGVSGVAMAELSDELGCPRDITKQEVVSAFLQVFLSRNWFSLKLWKYFCGKVVFQQCDYFL